jgi:hypothetical protein
MGKWSKAPPFLTATLHGAESPVKSPAPPEPVGRYGDEMSPTLGIEHQFLGHPVCNR